MRRLNKAFGSMRLADVRPSPVEAWTAQLKAADYADSTVYATYRRFAQIMGDAVQDGSSRCHLAVRRHRRVGSAAALRGHGGAGLGCRTRWTSAFVLSGEDRIIREQEDADRLLEVTRTEIAMQEATVDRLVREYRAKYPDSKVIEIE